MNSLIFAVALAAQAAAPVQQVPQPPARGSLSGVVVQSASGDPLPNVRVTLARVDIPKGAAAFAEMLGRQPEGAPPTEVALPSEFLSLMQGQADMMQRSIEQAKAAGVTDVGDDLVPPEIALLKELKADEIQTILLDPRGRMAIVSKSTPPMLSDGAGRFSFQNVEPGLYRLIFSASGLVRQDYGAPRGAVDGTPVAVGVGQAVEGLTMRMTPTGALSGRLTDSIGQSAADLSVQLTRFAYDGTGKRTAKPVASTRTNDRGEYRFYYLSPGNYNVQVLGTAQSGFVTEDPDFVLDEGLFGANGQSSTMRSNRIDERYATIYYPGTADSNAATAVEVAPGSETSGIDMVLSVQRFYRVRGRITDPRTGQAPKSAYIRLTGADKTTSSPNSIQQFYEPADGSFELRQVPGGNYVFRVDLPSLNPSRSTPPAGLANMTEAERTAFLRARAETEAAEQAANPRIATPLSVNADIDGLNPSGVVGSRLTGRARIEAVSAGEMKLEQIAIELMALGADGAPIAGYDSGTRYSQTVKADGSFRIEGVLPGDYALSVRNRLPGGFFVKSARIGDVDVLKGAVALPIRDPNAVLEVVVGNSAGQITGSVTSEDGRPLSGAQVVLVPDNNRSRVELFRSAATDGAGQFTISNVAPGEYRLAAWSWIEPFGYFDPAAIRQAEENGAAVKVEESSKQTITLKAISAVP